MLKVLKWIGIGFIVVVLIGVFFGEKKSGSGESASADAAPVEPYVTTSRELFAAYEENEVATDMRIDKRPVEITGIVKDITKDFSDDVVINLKTSNQFMSTRIGLDDGFEAYAAEISKGQTVTFVCKRMVRLIGSPSGSKCRPK